MHDVVYGACPGCGRHATACRATGCQAVTAADQQALDASVFSPEAHAATAEEIAAPEDPWLLRRKGAWGASEVPALLVALGRRDGSTGTKRMRDHAKRIHTKLGDYPRMVLEKAGARAALSHAGGGDRERELVATWARLGAKCAPFELDASSVWHRDDETPTARWMAALHPLVDRRCVNLAVTLDAACFDQYGDRGVIEAKCGDFAGHPHYLHERGLPWFLGTQAVSQMAATDCGFGLVLIGEGWAYREQGAISAWPVQRDESLVDEIRAACVDGWAMVQEVKSKMKEQKR